MKYLEEYRDARAVRAFAREIQKIARRDWTIMEICGGQTHSIVRFGLDELLPQGIRLVHGPGCPVCVTPADFIDQAIELFEQNPDAIVCTFGDMLRVPGSRESLASSRARGQDVRIVYSPLDALALAQKNPERQVVFLAVGFETTAPAAALAVSRAHNESIRNFSLLVSHVLVPPAIEALLSAESNQVQGFLAAGHVCTIMGLAEYQPLAERFGVPIVVTGFEPLDILQGIYLCVRQLEQGQHFVENQYSRSVRREGNRSAIALLREVFEVVSCSWRGLGDIPKSGLALRAKYAPFDARKRFGLAARGAADDPRCISGEVLRGVRRPAECAAFGKDCTPESPLGAPMVSSEGACAAYYRYRRAPGPTGAVPA
ncbi:MAG: hydrogenase formation protein HypD [Spirochaetales bacterium]|nr:hydrogenase formation protein HypD [Leptospiraceae bacterium]MCP5481533.1 hydrogenase formation protein HypD [Spirochaetales bacterium]MCP5484361.1 hydrogenase formation protein HypD [Spirochaetales bacterium]